MATLIALNGDLDLDLQDVFNTYEINQVIAVDGGIRHLSGYPVDYHIGDFDSSKMDEVAEVIKLNVKKDETDFAEAIYLANKLSDELIIVVGFLAQTRVEHFYNNLRHLTSNMVMLSKDSYIYMVDAGEHLIENSGYDYISFFNLYPDSKISIKNAKYEVDGYKTSPLDTLFVSNEFINEQPINLIIESMCLIFMSNKENNV